MDGQVASERERAGDDGRQRSFRSPEQLASLTPLRGIAALWVVIFHFCWYFPGVHPERYTGAVYKGYLAVDMFFVLSGFVITHVYKEGFAHRVTGRRYREFLKARVARIYPLHITVLLLFVATATAERAANYALRGSFEPIPLLGERSLGGLLANLVMLQGLWARELSWNDPSWSISLEFLAYLLFPLLFPLLWRAGAAAKAGLGGLLLVALTAPGVISTNGTAAMRSFAVCRSSSPECCCTPAIRAAFSLPCWPPTRRSRRWFCLWQRCFTSLRRISPSSRFSLC
jgi:peptidoglycan/LPS O-acetylase OafA/YrhL